MVLAVAEVVQLRLLGLAVAQLGTELGVEVEIVVKRLVVLSPVLQVAFQYLQSGVPMLDGRLPSYCR